MPRFVPLPMKKFVLPLLGLLALGTGFAAWKFSRFGYESAPYEVLEKDVSFEIREYPELTLVSTPAAGSEPGEGGSFMRLFRYISKGNENQEKIAMTTPVFMTEAEMSFVVPRAVADSGAPQPSSGQVELKSMAGGKVAAFRYNGSWKREKRRLGREKLAAWIEERELEPLGDYFSAGYDPPFTPGLFRRNEILVRLKE